MIKHLKQWWGWFMTPQTRIKVTETHGCYGKVLYYQSQYRPLGSPIWFDCCTYGHYGSIDLAKCDVEVFLRKYKTKTTYIKYP